MTAYGEDILHLHPRRWKQYVHLEYYIAEEAGRSGSRNLCDLPDCFDFVRLATSTRLHIPASEKAVIFSLTYFKMKRILFYSQKWVLKSVNIVFQMINFGPSSGFCQGGRGGVHWLPRSVRDAGARSASWRCVWSGRRTRAERRWLLTGKRDSDA